MISSRLHGRVKTLLRMSGFCALCCNAVSVDFLPANDLALHTSASGARVSGSKCFFYPFVPSQSCYCLPSRQPRPIRSCRHFYSRVFTRLPGSPFFCSTVGGYPLPCGALFLR